MWKLHQSCVGEFSLTLTPFPPLLSICHYLLGLPPSPRWVSRLDAWRIENETKNCTSLINGWCQCLFVLLFEACHWCIDICGIAEHGLFCCWAGRISSWRAKVARRSLWLAFDSHSFPHWACHSHPDLNGQEQIIVNVVISSLHRCHLPVSCSTYLVSWSQESSLEGFEEMAADEKNDPAPKGFDISSRIIVQIARKLKNFRT